MDDERTDGRQQNGSPQHHPARAALARLGLAATTAVLCMMLVFGIGWVTAELW